MSALILSGVGGSTNWLPLIFPLVAIVIILKGGEFFIKFIKRKQLERENQLINKITSSVDDVATSGIEQKPDK